MSAERRGPLFSVIVPARNAESHVAETVGSVLAQRCADLEVLVVDDASTDKTVEHLRGIEDARLRLLTASAHGRVGANAARNLGLDHARGRWIAFLDADDWWSPEHLSRLARTAEQATADFVAGDLLYEQAAREAHRQRSLLAMRDLHLGEPAPLTLTDFIRWDLGVVKPIVHRDVLGRGADRLRFPAWARVTGDFHFLCRCVARAHRPVVSPQATYHYRRGHGPTLSSSSPAMWRDALRVTTDLFLDPGVTGLPGAEAALERRLEEQWLRYQYLHTSRALRRGRPRDAVRRLLRHPALVRVPLRRPTVTAVRHAVAGPGRRLTEGVGART